MIPHDADIEMAEMEQAGNDIYNGVCPICDEPVDPSDPKWDHIWHERYTRAAAIKSGGPHSNMVDGYHDRCINEPDFI